MNRVINTVPVMLHLHDPSHYLFKIV